MWMNTTMQNQQFMLRKMNELEDRRGHNHHNILDRS